MYVRDVVSAPVDSEPPEIDLLPDHPLPAVQLVTLLLTDQLRLVAVLYGRVRLEAVRVTVGGGAHTDPFHPVPAVQDADPVLVPSCPILPPATTS